MMIEWSKITQNDLKALIQNTAVKMKIQENVVEKDYWICLTLDYLFHHSKWNKSFTFKGGSSLSKCFSLIERFSEDVDLILDWRLLGYQKDEPWQARSNTKQDQFNKDANERMQVFLSQKFVHQMRTDLEKILGKSFGLEIDEDYPQTILFYYPKLFSSNYLVEAIRLEIGSLAAWTPSEEGRIEPYISKAYPLFFEGKKIEVRTVSVERTFWEKATILHHEAHRPKELKMPARYTRHYYDVYCIASSKYKEQALEQLHLLDKVVQFKEKFYPRKWAKYNEATKSQIKLIPEAYRHSELRDDYEQMKEMFMGEVPKFDNLLAVIKDLEEKIHRM